MKTIKYLSLRVFAVIALALVFALPTKAQMTDNGYANIDWQYNFPLSNNFVDKSSGWGMNFEGGYFLTDNFALGAFLNYHSNHEYF
ncbi:outer membrane beta-barrel protein, partial [uncultured Bacteroides sp.]